MKLGNKIKRILSADAESFTVELEFDDGVRSRISLRDIFEHPKGLAADVLRGGAFDKCFIESGALAWPNGLEFCPDSLYQRAFLQKHPSKKLAA